MLLCLVVLYLLGIDEVSRIVSSMVVQNLNRLLEEVILHVSNFTRNITLIIYSLKVRTTSWKVMARIKSAERIQVHLTTTKPTKTFQLIIIQWIPLQ